MSVYVVSIYMVDRAYGGPEEGGWWYEVGTPLQGGWLKYMTTCVKEKTAEHRRAQIQRWLDIDYNIGPRTNLDSVLCTGRYVAVIDVDKLPVPYPAERPYYE
jgi:hypothetical protein